MRSRTVRMRLTPLLLTALVVGGAGCNGDSGSESNGGTDAGSDAVGDTGSDARSDSGDTRQRDSGATDADVDAQTDTASDTGPTTIDVSGRAFGDQGFPLANARVLLLSGKVTTTNSNGEFSFEDVEPPYGLGVVRTVDIANRPPKDHVAIYPELTSPNPNVTHVGIGAGRDQHEAEILGEVTGGYFDESNPPSFRTGVVFGAPRGFQQLLFLGSSFSFDSGSFNSIKWIGSQPLTGRLRALQWEVDGNGFPKTYNEYGVGSELQLNDGDGLGPVDVALDQNADDGTLQGAARVPSGFQYDDGSLAAVVDDEALLTISALSSGSKSYSLVTPDVDGVSLAVQASAEPANGNASTSTFRPGLPANTNSADVELVAPPELQSPANNSSGVGPGTEFSWTAFDGGVHILELVPNNRPTGNPSIYVVTDETEAKLPELKAFGVSIPANAQYRWRVEGLGPLETVASSAFRSKYVNRRGTDAEGEPRPESVGFTKVQASASDLRTLTTGN